MKTTKYEVTQTIAFSDREICALRSMLYSLKRFCEDWPSHDLNQCFEADVASSFLRLTDTEIHNGEF